MSEYWVSKKKYFCKYCNIYIADDVPSRRQHEGGLKHKGNVERFVRGLYKAGEKRKQDLDEEKRDMARVEQAAQAAFARDVGAGLVKPGSGSAPVASTSSASSERDKKPASPWANYSTAESLGFTDPDAERLKAEAERRRMEGVAGEWEVVAVSEPEPPVLSEADQKSDITASQDPTEGSSRKREAQEIIDDEDGRQWKLRKKTLGVGLGEIYDPGVIQIKLKPKKESSETLPPQESTVGPSSMLGSSRSAATTMPKWSSRGWNKPGADNTDTDHKKSPSDEGPSESSKDDVPDVKKETETSSSILPSSDGTDKLTESVKLEEEAHPQSGTSSAGPGTGLFRKRKVPAGGAGSRGARF